MANLLKLILALPDATNAEEMARYILGLRAAGKADEVTEAMMAAADDSYMYANTPLDMSQEARMARADEMFPREGFHGTNADIDAFQGNVFSTDNPTLASTYARGGMTDAQIYPLRLGSKLGDTVVEGGGANWNQLDVDEIYKNDPAVAGWLGYDEIADGSGKASTRGVERAAMYEGRSGVQFKDINDIGPGFNSNQFKNLGYTKEQELAFKQQYMEDLSKPSNIDVRLSPNLVRSKFARFDPEFRNLRNLSASLFATLGFSGLAEGLRDKGILPTEGESVMVNYIKAAIDLGKPVVKAVGEAFDALGNKIGALPDAITTYHGSPHDFDEFDMSKIGTGEGAQAYGRGLYFAENENVAKEYRDNISSQALDGAKAVLQRVGGDVDAAIADRVNALSRFEERYSQGDIDDGLYQFMKNLGRGQIEQLKQYKNKGDFTKGHMYEVNIDATADDFLDWDKPLSEQPESFIDIVKNADLTILPEGGRLRRTIEAWRKNEGDWVPEISANIPEPTVKQIYSALTDFGTNPSKNANFSNELKNSGFKGVKYLDQFSRSAGAGTRNYVVFDDKLVSIVRKYGIAGAATIYGVSEADIANALQEGEQ
jgi:hypothetical protein